MFIKHGDGKIVNIVEENSDLEKEAFDKLKKLPSKKVNKLEEDKS